MPIRYQINEDKVTELEKARKENKDKNIERRLRALLLHAEGKSRSEIADKTGFVKTYISELVAKYCNNGIMAIVENKYPGNRRNMSLEEEKALLDGFRDLAEQGQVIEVSDIKKAYEEKVGHTIGGSQIYYVLRRHGWRKVMPRSKHPNKASDEAIEASKKLTQSSRMSWKILQAEKSG
jgi:transposase